MGNPKIYADDMPIRHELRVWQGHNQVQPESALAVHQISTIIADTLFQQINCIWIQMKFHHLPALKSGQRNAISPDGIRALVIADGAEAASGTTHRLEGWNRFPAHMSAGNLFGILSLSFHFPSERRFDGFGRFHSGRNDQLSRQQRVQGAQLIIGRLMQFHAILFTYVPTIGSDCVEAVSVLLHRFKQNTFLLWCSLKWDTNGSLHKAHFSTNILRKEFRSTLRRNRLGFRLKTI